MTPQELYTLLMEHRAKILPLIHQRCNSTVISGPFKGMKILPKYCWGDGDTAGKLLGLYEDELYPTIEEEITKNHDLVVNYGCAEGFYGIGMAMRLPTTPVVLFDREQIALDVAKENANVNGVTNIEYTLQCNFPYIEGLLSKYKNPFIIMDCEGAEDIVLDPIQLPSLVKTTVLVETHDCLRQGITDRIVHKFNETHDMFSIIQGTKNVYIDPIHDLSDTDKWILNNENRPSTMMWVHMIPRTNNESI